MDVKMLCTMVIGVVMMLLSPSADGYSSGAPFQKCDNMEPSPTAHGPPQTTNIPYKLVVKDQLVDAGQELQLEIKKIDESTPDFKGFIVQGRDVKTDKRVGSFVVPDNE